ncbi:MAG TPA: ABC transporter substrate-binding protein [Chloroflexota bacterium]|nr:ABC transporter substrate-binding protein [Chloroflexota bacterium]HZU07287.1 ABC transporter substrate-binding protein [Chloroflexota bacterium]
MKQSYLAHIRLTTGIALLFACAPVPTAPPVSQAPVESTASAATTAPLAPPPLHPPVLVKVSDGGTVAHRGLYIGLERGYFAEEGLEIERVPSRGTPDTIAALVTGDLHFGSGGPDPIIFNAALRGVGVKIVTYLIQIGQGDLSSGFVVRKDLVDSGRYQGLEDFRGLTVALPGDGGLQHLFLERLLSRGGLTLADVQTVVLPFPDMVPALANRAIDAAFLAEPFISVAEAQGVAMAVMPMGEIYPGVPGNVMTISPRFAAQHPEAARRYVTAHLRGQRDYYRAVQRNEGGRDEIVQILMKYTPIKDPALYARLLTSPVDPNLTLDAQPLNEIQDYYVKFGTLQQRVDVSQVLDRSYAEYALARLGRLP